MAGVHVVQCFGELEGETVPSILVEFLGGKHGGLCFRSFELRQQCGEDSFASDLVPPFRDTGEQLENRVYVTGVAQVLQAYASGTCGRLELFSCFGDSEQERKRSEEGEDKMVMKREKQTQ